jgi:Zn-dependent protease with chaperone function
MPAAATLPPRFDGALRRKAARFLILLPLLVLLYPLLQSWRVQDDAREHASYTRYLQAEQAGDTAGLRIPYGFARYAPQARGEAIAARLTDMDANAGSLALRRGLAWASLATAAAALLLAWLLLAAVERARRRALASPAYLIAHFAQGWRRASRLLMAQTGLMMLTLLLNVAFEVLWSREHWSTHGFVAVLMTLPLWGGIVAVAGMLIKLRSALAPTAPIVLEATARALSRSAAPRLWQWLETIAARIDAPLPDHVAVGLADGFYVTSAAVRLLPHGELLGGRTLHLPLALAACLSEREAAFVVGHELGHFAHADTDHGQQLALLHRAMQARIGWLAEQVDAAPSWLAQPPLWASLYILASFDHAYGHWSRQQELAADRVGARASDAEAGALALLRIGTLLPLLDEALQARSGNAVTALHALLAAAQPQLDDAQLADALPHPVDSHPPTRMRLQALGVAVDDALLARALRAADVHDQGWFAALLAPATTPT